MSQSPLLARSCSACSRNSRTTGIYDARRPGLSRQPGFFCAPSPRIARDPLAGVAAADAGELALEDRREREAVQPFLRKRYDRGSGDVCREITSFSGCAPIRLQTLPEQKNLPNAQASTRSRYGPFMAMVA